MLNFASLFNQWRTQNNNGVLDLLTMPNLDMGRLLDEESFQAEYKSGSAKIVEFMTYQRYEELIEYVTVVGPADDKKRSFKYPANACQLLTIENNAALDFFLPDKTIVLQTKTEETVEVETEVEVEESPQNKIKEEETASEPQSAETADKPSQEGKNEEATVEKADKPKQDKKPEQTEQTDKVEPKAEEKVAEEEASVKPEEKGEASVQIVVQEDAVAKEGTAEESAASDESPNKPKQSLAVETPEKKFKKVMRKEMKIIEKIEEKEVPALIYKLLAYFEGEVNYTLAGYVSKILAMLLTKKPADLMKYVLQESTMHKIIEHAESRSVGEFIIKVLTHESTLLLDQRRQFFKELLKRTSVPSEISVISNLSSYIVETIEKVAANLKSNTKITELNTTFFSLDIITQVIKNVMSDEECVAVYNAPILLSYLTNVPFVLPEDENVVSEFIKLGEIFVEKSCGKLQVDKRSRPKLGTGRMKIIEILRFIIKQNVLNSKENVAKTAEFFPILFNLIRQYQLNNILHNEIIRILEIALGEPEDSLLNQAVLKDDLLLNFIVEEWAEDKKIIAGDSVYKSRKGFIAHIINLCVKLREMSEKNENIKKLTEGSAFTSVYENFVEREVFNSKKSLAGLNKKQFKHQILFQKEDILASHLTFLQKCPTSVFEPEPIVADHINIDAPDLVEELQRQLDENINMKSAEEEKTPGATADEANIESEGVYWSNHMEFNIDDLMVDL